MSCSLSQARSRTTSGPTRRARSSTYLAGIGDRGRRSTEPTSSSLPIRPSDVSPRTEVRYSPDTRATDHAFSWRARLGSVEIDGADFFHADEDGLIDEIRVYLRPLSALGAFASAIGPPLARQREAPFAFLARPVGRSLPFLFNAVSS